MAEAFGVGAGIVSVLGLTIQITQVVVQLGLDWNDAPTDVKSFMQELRSLRTVLSTTTNLLEDSYFKKAFQDRPSILLSQLGPNAPATTETALSIESCKAELEKVLDGLKKRDDGSRFGWERLKGPFLDKSTRKSMGTLRGGCQLFNNMVSIDALTMAVTTHGEIRESRREQREWHDAKEHQEILNWISKLSFEEKQTDILSKCHPGTGKWLLNHESFQNWRNGVHDEPSALWCPGIPGAGKSVMTSLVIDHLQQGFTREDVSISYIYCDYKDRKTQTTVNLISSLVKQMVLQQSDMPREVIDLYAKCKDGQVPLSLEDHSKLLSSFSHHFRRSFILVDALDEHFINDDEQNAAQLTLLDTLLNLHSSGGYTLFFTSREHQLIKGRLAACARLDIRTTDFDIELYLRSRISDPTKFKFAQKLRNDADLGDLIVSKLVKKAQGMFLLPRLHLDRLRCQTNVRDLRKALESLPVKFNETYDDAMARIQGQVQEHSKLAFSALSWISNALRPLRLDELQHALAVRLGDHSLDEEALEDEALIISVSAGLITLDAQSRTMRLVHFTVEEYFRGMQQKWFPDADRRISKTCLTYLSFDIFESGRCLFDQELEVRLHKNRFLDYAARNWGHHVSRVEDHAVENLALEFLGSNSKVSCSNQVMLAPESGYRHRYFSQDLRDQVFGMHLAANFGLRSIVKMMLEAGTAVDAKDSAGQTPLSYAAAAGHETIVKFLVSCKGVAADSKDRRGRSPLSWAAANGHETIVKFLVSCKGVAADSTDRGGRSPLSWAAGNGHETIVKFLVSCKGVAADSTDRGGRSPLSLAAANGHETIVKFLVSCKGVAADSTDWIGQSPLSWAAENGHETVVKLLEEKLQNTR